MSYRKQELSQAVASAKAGFSERTGRRVEREGAHPKLDTQRHWRTRKDAFEEVWVEEVLPRLEARPALDATTLFEDLQERHAGRFPNSCKRTFQRRVKAWKAHYGPDKEVMFRQQQLPGRLGLSDFTELKDIVVTIGGVALSHRLYHFRLPFSGWSHVKVVLGGESWTALATGLQGALWRLGGAPVEHRTDSLSAAYRNLSADEQADLTQRYERLCAHYGMTPTRNNRGASHENGAVEAAHGHLKRRIRQGLLLRESSDFATLTEYQDWLEALVQRFNRRCGDALRIEREALQALPARRTTDYSELVVAVTSSSTIEVKRVLYTVPARLVGERLRVHLYDERLECYLGTTHTVTLPRVYGVAGQRGRCVDYRHVIGQLVRKPQAFRYSQLRDELLPTSTYRAIWQQVDNRLEPRAACKLMVGVLALAADADCERPLGDYLLLQLTAGQTPTLHALEQRFGGAGTISRPDLKGPGQHPLSGYAGLVAQLSLGGH
jgi:hypothetical protein